MSCSEHVAESILDIETRWGAASSVKPIQIAVHQPNLSELIAFFAVVGDVEAALFARGRNT